MTAALTFRNLTLGYDRHPVIHHLEAEIAEGSLTAIVGPNGAGKSTLLKGVTGTLTPLEGGGRTWRDQPRRYRLSAPAVGYRPLLSNLGARSGGHGALA